LETKSLQPPSTALQRHYVAARHQHSMVDMGRKRSPSTARADQGRLKQAAQQFAEGVERGMDEDDVAAMQLGATDATGLTKKQQYYLDKVKAKLAEQAAEAKRERELKSIKFTQGKRAYSTGQYDASMVLFQDALEQEGDLSPLGGEIQLWLALAYQANGMEAECIELYKSIEKNHPLPKVKRQAASLRYIMEAPKLKLGEDEKVKLPILEATRYQKPRGSPSRPIPKSPTPSDNSKRKKTLEEEFWDNYKPPIPDLAKNRYLLVAGTILATGIAWYSVVLGNKPFIAR